MLKTLLCSLAVAATLAFPCAPEVVAAETGYAPQTSNERGIKVTVTPQATPKATKNWDVEVVLESHTQDLSDDLTNISMLIASGKQYQPLVWEGAPPGGHHRKGLLRFKVIVPPPPFLELQIRLAGDATPRSFKWLLK